MTVSNTTDSITAGAHHARFGHHYGWWVGVLRRWHADVWECGHQHEDRKRAAKCAQHTLDAATGVIHEPIRWRPGNGISGVANDQDQHSGKQE